MSTKQRQIILKTLKGLKTHPTADELHTLVRKLMPNISLATVYRNLNYLADQGEILRIEFSGDQKRFDANTKLHYHFRCRQCGKIYDLSIPPLSSVRQKKSIDDHDIYDHHLEFYGVCVFCKKELKNGKTT